MAEGYYDIDDLLDYDSTLAVALGNMVVAWARAETILVFAFSAICGIKTDMATLGYYRIPSFEARVKVLRAMISEWQTRSTIRTPLIEPLSGSTALLLPEMIGSMAFGLSTANPNRLSSLTSAAQKATSGDENP